MTYNQSRKIRFTQIVVFMDFLVKEFAVSLSQNPYTAVLPRVPVFRDVTLRHCVNVPQHFEVTGCVHLRRALDP
jgi:hypothetical protein